MGSAPMPDRIERLSWLAQALAGAPTPDELARLLALRIFDSWGCRGVLIFRPEASGALRLHAMFGYPDASRLELIAYDPESPMHRAMSGDDILWFPDRIDVTDAINDSGVVPSATNGLIVMPITHIGVPEEVIVLSFDDPLPSNPASEPFVNAVRSLLELHAGGIDAPRGARSSHDRGRRLGAPITAADVELTERQMRILGMLAMGRTNRAIAAELGFSESTIRQETLRLYRALDVNSRVDAVHVAESIGLLPVD